jgi:putative spermidine/putrescine transport system substrate-binding protein
MKKTLLSGAIGALALALAGPVAARDLTVVSWGGAYQDAQREVYFKPFMDQTKTKMLEESWDGGVGVLRAKIQGGNNNWDVVQVESEELVLGCEEGLYEKIDWAKLGGKDKFLPDAVNDCGVGAIVYNFVIGYDKDKIKDGPKNWADFWDVQKFPGKRALRKGPKTNLEIALMADGVPFKDVYKTLKTEAGVERAFKKLDQLKPNLIWWEKGSQPPQLLASGEVAMTSVYNGRIDTANKNDKKNFGMVWDGALFTLDSWVILKGSPNKDAAYKFLDFAGKAENQSKLSENIAYGTSNKDAAALLAPAVLKDLPTAPDNIKNAVEINVAFWLENIDRLTERFNKWAAK